MPHSDLSLDAVHRARMRLEGISRRTPLATSGALSRLTGANVKLKLEGTQDTRSFKVRGAGNAIISLLEAGEVKRLVTYSTGNHGRATTHIAAQLGLPVTVCVSSNTTDDKRSDLADLGAEVRVVGNTQDAAARAASALVDSDTALVDPIDDPATTAGHATIGLELLEDWPEVDTVVVPVSGGALIAGVALAVKSAGRSVRVIGVSMDRGAAMHASLQAGRPVEVPEFESLADSLQGGIGLDNTHTFRMVRELVDDLILVSEDQIGLAMALALGEERLVLEGAGACPIAAMLAPSRPVLGDNVALIATGAMVGAEHLCRIAARHSTGLAELLGKAAV
ncbi:hydroxyectoine utilization dehydratase EutB [soil metagenome]